MTTADDLRARFPGLSDGWVRLDGPAGTLPVDTCVDQEPGRWQPGFVAVTR